MGAKTKRRRKLKIAAKRRRTLERLKERAKSEWCAVQESGIHGAGVYATMLIPAGTRIIEYVGEKIDKEESERRAWAQMAQAEMTGDAAVYIFTLTDKHDLDGSVEWNTARLLNHSCDPNCETWITGKRIFIYALRDIEPGEELTFDYGFEVECWEDHPCRCGSQDCVGYIVRREDWSVLEELKRELGLERKESA
ncbi:MAG: SET domain-containing protein-lysine N-methyltransferase [Verrucomicrobia bacterium]|nr:SET domain-containing protein-lysine N-methyltransferase [Verrucomicrobiota bacterium]MDA1006772.1 SET domain-containing protein-lysine N-methyltransferase [Verrucomicrobiota bacterium]